MPRPVVYAFCLLPLLAASVACGPSAEEKRLEALAGTDVYEYELQPSADRVRVHERQTLTLRPDHTWSMTRLAEINDKREVDATESGRFVLDGATLIVRSEESGVSRYTVSGDTLWTRSAQAIAETKAVTGIEMKAEESFLVRER